MDWKKRLKYGSYAVFTTITATGIFILLTLIVSSQNWNIDMTKNKIYSLSEQTKQVLSKLNQDINVYVFYIKGREDENVNRLLENYKKNNSHIKIQYLEAAKHPEIIRKYNNIIMDINYDPRPVCVVFDTDKRVKVVNHYETLNYSTDKEEFIGEQKYTNAIRYVTSEKVPAVYFLQGHKEPPLESITIASELLKMENYNVKTLNLLTQKSIPDDADIIIDISPQKAFFPEELKELERFFINGGKGAFFIDPPANEKQDISSLKDMFKKWGVDINDDVVVEGDPNFYYQDHTLLIPEIQSHEISEPIKSSGLNVLIGYARSLKLSSINDYNVESILKSSSNSWGKLKIEKTLNKEEGDLTGPLNLAAVITKNLQDDEGKEMKVFICGSSSAVSDSIIQNGGNSDLFLNVVGWLRGTPEEMTIRPKQTLNTPLTMNSTQRIITNITVLIIIPGMILIAGLVVWMRRRHL